MHEHEAAGAVMKNTNSSTINSPMPLSVVQSRGEMPSSAAARPVNRTRGLVLPLLAADLAALVTSVAIAGGLGYEISKYFLKTPYQAWDSSGLAARLAIWAMLSAGVCIWFYAAGHYTIRRPLREDMPRIGAALSLLLLIDGFVQFATRADFSRVWLVSIWLVAAALIPLARILVRRMLNALGVWKLKAVIVGRGSHVEAVREGLSGDSYLGYQILPGKGPEWFNGQRREELATKVREFRSQSGVEVVFLVPDNEELEDSKFLLDVLNIQMVPYAIVPPIHRLPLIGLHMQAFLSSDAVLMTVRSGLLSPMSRAVKRAFDILVSLVLAIFFAPLLLVVAAIVATDGGPVLFGHRRVGHRGQTFRCLKFRTMVPDAQTVLQKLLDSDPALQAEWASTFKLKSDPRITPVGRFLRKTSLDELPQLFNVIVGTMSLVGPRPVVASELEEFYGEDALYYRLVLPGITGLWQISGRSDTGYNRRVHLDAWYVRNWSLWSDILILLGTLPSVLRSRGAY
jgi:Undecaprenyl-phosphate galactose phosphotransferase WbaP